MYFEPPVLLIAGDILPEYSLTVLANFRARYVSPPFTHENHDAHDDLASRLSEVNMGPQSPIDENIVEDDLEATNPR